MLKRVNAKMVYMRVRYFYSTHSLQRQIWDVIYKMISCHDLEVTWGQQNEKLPKSKLDLEKKTWDQITFEFNIYCHLTCLKMLKNWPIYIEIGVSTEDRGLEKKQKNNSFRHSQILILYFTVLSERKKDKEDIWNAIFQNHYCLAAEGSQKGIWLTIKPPQAAQCGGRTVWSL